MNLLKDFDELIKADVITQETADRIQEYYKKKRSSSTNSLFIIFGILGTILVELGILLIIAHNWDELSRFTKTIFAFLPLLAGQILCGYVIVKRFDIIAWRESTAVFLFFSIGACLSLVSQIYNIPGDPDTFILTWMLLALPLIYLINSSITSLLYLVGITYYALYQSYRYHPSAYAYLYWMLLLAVLPHYYVLYRKNSKSNFMILPNWIIPASVIIALGTVAKKNGEIMYIAYFSFFGLLYLIGILDFFTRQNPRNNGYKILGSLGTVVLLLALSFDWYWINLTRKLLQFNEIISAPEFIASVVASISAGILLFLQIINKTIHDIKPVSLVFILFIFTFLVGLTSSPIAIVLINLYILTIGILMIRDGAKQDHLGILNYGLLIMTALVICRFFDAYLSFVFRGMLFVLVGTGLFYANYWMLKKRKTDD